MTPKKRNSLISRVNRSVTTAMWYRRKMEDHLEVARTLRLQVADGCSRDCGNVRQVEQKSHGSFTDCSVQCEVCGYYRSFD